MHSANLALVEYPKKEEQMQLLSTSPTRDQFSHLEQLDPQPSIACTETTLVLAQAVIAKEAAALNGSIAKIHINTNRT
jgi:hypothetical protein